MTALALFASTFLTVFALGFQSLNVNGGHYAAAAITSFLISGGNLVLFKVVPGQLGELELLAYFAGGPLAIVCSMAVHRRTVGRRRRRTTGPTISVAEARARDDAGERYFDLRGEANINCGADRP